MAGVLAAAAGALLLFAPWLFESGVKPRDITTFRFENRDADFKELSGGGQYVFQEGLIGEWLRFKVDAPLRLKDASRYAPCDPDELGVVVTALLEQFPGDRESLADRMNLSCSCEDDKYYLANRRTGVHFWIRGGRSAMAGIVRQMKGLSSSRGAAPEKKKSNPTEDPRQ